MVQNAKFSPTSWRLIHTSDIELYDLYIKNISDQIPFYIQCVSTDV